MRTPYTRPRAGFTLIELLVVVSIIALLMAVLMPSLSKARKQAQSLLCMTHLRELSHGWHMYADDNNDISLPGRFFKQPGGTSNPDNWYEIGNGLKYRPRWVAAMGEQVGAYAYNQPRTDFDRQDYDNKVYQCPTVPKWIDERNYAYGYNHQFLGNARRAAGKFYNFPVPRTRIRSFSGTVLAADCLGTAAGVPIRDRRPYENDGTGYNQLGNHGWVLDPPRLTEASDRGTGDADSPRTAAAARHLGKTNVIYCDGHAEHVTVEKLGYRIRSDGSFADSDTHPDQPTNRWFSGTGQNIDPPDKPSA